MGTTQWRAIPLISVAVATVLAGSVAAAATTAQHHPPAASNTLWATQLMFDNHGTAWSQASFAALRAKGMNSAEVNMSWNSLEPAPGKFSFAELDQELGNAAAAGFRLVPIFWQSGWSGSPAAWITSHEISSGGAPSATPAWWDPTEQAAYFTYVTQTVKHIANNPGYGGAVLNYGFLDAQWDFKGGAEGWSQANIDQFHQHYLPNTFGTIAAFNARNHTSFASFAQVPAARPGQPLTGVYQAFRVWSLVDTYSRLTAGVRAVTSGPLYYYYGGHLANGPDYANIPDLFFMLAKKYTVTVILDSAQATGLALTFGPLARAYGVRLAQEWTAPSDPTQLDAQAVQWVSNYGMGLPQGGGEDFFIHDGTQKDVHGFPIYTAALSTLQGLTGSFPQAPAAVYLDFSLAFGNSSGGSLNSVEDAVANLWVGDQAGFAVITSQEVANGVVSLAQYKAILPLNGIDANLMSYQASGGTIMANAAQLAHFAPAYARLSSTGSLQTVPVVAADHGSAAITLAEINATAGFTGAVVFSPAALNLNPGSYHAVNGSGVVVTQKSVANGDVCVAVNLGSARLSLLRMVAGPIPAGTPAPAACPA